MTVTLRVLTNFVEIKQNEPGFIGSMAASSTVAQFDRHLDYSARVPSARLKKNTVQVNQQPFLFGDPLEQSDEASLTLAFTTNKETPPLWAQSTYGARSPTHPILGMAP